jgi:hypothetical protein
VSDEIVGFGRDDADEIIRKVFQNKTFSGFPGPPTENETSLVLAYTASGATARSGTTLGTGTATRRYLSGAAATRTITSSSDSVTFYNVAASAVSGGKYIMLLRLGATWLCVWEEC